MKTPNSFCWTHYVRPSPFHRSDIECVLVPTPLSNLADPMNRPLRTTLALLASFILTACLFATPNFATAQASHAGGTTLKGNAAWDSPQGKVLAEFLRAARAGDKSALKKVMATSQSDTLDGPNAASFLDFLKSALDPKVATFDSLVMNATGTSALATISGRYAGSGGNSGGEVTKRYTINKADDGWRVTM